MAPDRYGAGVSHPDSPIRRSLRPTIVAGVAVAALLAVGAAAVAAVAKGDGVQAEAAWVVPGATPSKGATAPADAPKDAPEVEGQTQESISLSATS
jgi:hypothetical protein